MDWSFLLLISLFVVGCLLMAWVMMSGSRMYGRMKGHDPAAGGEMRNRDDTPSADDVTLRE